MRSIPIAIAFTLTSGAALIVHFWYLLRVYRNRRAVQHSATNGGARRWAQAFVNVETTRFILNACLFLSGVGALAGGSFRILVWLLVVLPAISITSSTFALKGFD